MYIQLNPFLGAARASSRFVPFVALVSVAACLGACGGGGSSGPAYFAVGGTVSGLSTGSLVLTDGTDVVTVPLGASTYVFPTKLVDGSSYAITVQTQPVGETCEIQNASGTVNGTISSAVSCALNQYALGGSVSGLTSGELVLANGTDTVTVASGATTFSFPNKVNYGVSYSVSVQGLPPQGACNVTGGTGTVTGPVNSVHVSCGYGLWAWMSGTNQPGAAGVYGIESQPAATNVPGARGAAASWVDGGGNLWLFGGADLNYNLYGDLWSFNPTTGNWTWAGGSSQPNGGGVHPLLGSSSATSAPSARQQAAFWTDINGNFWLFGGSSCSGRPNDCGEVTNDLWKFSTATGQWTWVGGPNLATLSEPFPGTYGTQGAPAAGNLPGGRYDAITWTDASGNLWLFGGYGYASSATYPLAWLNDLWMYAPNTGLWTWEGGSSTTVASASYGTMGVASSNNNPGPRLGATAWADASGNLWLFGGNGPTASGQGGQYFSDLWMYSTSSGQWAWVGGTNPPSSGSFGVQGFAASSNVPPCRMSGSGWIDKNGIFWLFGGMSNVYGALGDLWSYDPRAGNWTWVGGSNLNSPAVSYGSLGIAALGNTPGGRQQAMAWIDPTGNLWLYGGLTVAQQLTPAVDYNDLWRFSPAP